MRGAYSFCFISLVVHSTAIPFLSCRGSIKEYKSTCIWCKKWVRNNEEMNGCIVSVCITCKDSSSFNSEMRVSLLFPDFSLFLISWWIKGQQFFLLLPLRALRLRSTWGWSWEWEWMNQYNNFTCLYTMGRKRKDSLIHHQQEWKRQFKSYWLNRTREERLLQRRHHLLYFRNFCSLTPYT
jgi:hypothetical protein